MSLIILDSSLSKVNGIRSKFSRKKPEPEQKGPEVYLATLRTVGSLLSGDMVAFDDIDKSSMVLNEPREIAADQLIGGDTSLYYLSSVDPFEKEGFHYYQFESFVDPHVCIRALFPESRIVVYLEAVK